MENTSCADGTPLCVIISLHLSFVNPILYFHVNYWFIKRVSFCHHYPIALKRKESLDLIRDLFWFPLSLIKMSSSSSHSCFAFVPLERLPALIPPFEVRKSFGLRCCARWSWLSVSSFPFHFSSLKRWCLRIQRVLLCWSGGLSSGFSFAAVPGLLNISLAIIWGESLVARASNILVSKFRITEQLDPLFLDFWFWHSPGFGVLFRNLPALSGNFAPPPHSLVFHCLEGIYLSFAVE